MSKPTIFDQPHYKLLNEARAERVRELLNVVNSDHRMQSAIDVGCGLGYFSGFLQSLGMDVLGVDGRAENAAEARRRLPQVRFETCSAEDSALRDFGEFDLVLCFGLLYHLENPMTAIRILKEITKQLLLVESVIFPGEEPIMALVDEGGTEDQGINYVAFYPTEACLIKLLYRVGFKYVYRFTNTPNHVEYQTRIRTRKTRTMLAASHEQFVVAQLQLMPEPKTRITPWDPASGNSFATKLKRIVAN